MSEDQKSAVGWYGYVTIVGGDGEEVISRGLSAIDRTMPVRREEAAGAVAGQAADAEMGWRLMLIVDRGKMTGVERVEGWGGGGRGRG